MYLIVIAVCRYAREDTHYLLYIYDLMRLRLVNESSGENDLLLEVNLCFVSAFSRLPYLLSNFGCVWDHSRRLRGAVWAPRAPSRGGVNASTASC